MRIFIQDLRHGVRILAGGPGFTAVALLTLTLGIGVNTAIFSFFNVLMLRPLQVKNPSAIVNVYHSVQNESDYGSLSYPEYVYLRDQNTVLSGLAVFSGAHMVLSGVGDKSTGSADGEALQAMLVSGNYFSVLGENPAPGRAFLPEEAQSPGSHPVVILSYTYWQRRFNGEPSIIGKTLTLNLLPYTVVGIAPRGFEGTTPDPIDVWVPLMMQSNAIPGSDFLHDRHQFWLQSVGRLKPGIQREPAQAEMTVLARQFAQPSDDVKREMSITLTPGTLLNPRDFKQVLPVGLLLVLAAGLVLLIACANVANLALARSLSRQKEIGIRLSLGASRSRIVRQLLTENMLLSLAGGAAGLILAVWLLDLLIPFLHPPGERGIHLNVSLDISTLAYTLLLSMLTGIAFGLTPALRSSKQDPLVTLKEEGTAFGRRVSRSRLRSMLVVAQVAMSLILLVGAGLLVRALAKAQRVDPGFEMKNVLVMSANVKLQNYDAAHAASFDLALEERLAALPGVRRVGLGAVAPLGTSFWDTNFNPDDYPSSPNDPTTYVNSNTVSPGYFETLGIPLMRGRVFTPEDIAQNRKVAVISEALARHFWPGQDPVGKKFNKGREVIGVAKDVRSVHLWAADDKCLYLPVTPEDSREMMFFVRTAGNPGGLMRALSEAARSIAPSLPVKVSRLEDNLAQWIWASQMGALLSSALGGLALILALMGIYGVTSYAVSQRTHEIGVRMALGAKNSDVLRLVLGQSMHLVAVGVAIGLAISATGARLLARFLYGLSAFDAMTFGGVAALLAVVALAACYVPARRAMRVDPMVALRYE
jgi:predicted permease